MSIEHSVSRETGLLDDHDFRPDPIFYRIAGGRVQNASKKKFTRLEPFLYCLNVQWYVLENIDGAPTFLEGGTPFSAS